MTPPYGLGTHLGHPAPPLGAIFAIAHAAGIEFRSAGDKRPILCPFHPDRHASAFVSVRNIFFCSVCTPDGGWTARRFAQALGVPWRGGAVRPYSSTRRRSPTLPTAPVPTFAPDQAEHVWKQALTRAESVHHAKADQRVYEYLDRRGLTATRGRGLFGVLATGMALPDLLAFWPGSGYRIVAPLFDSSGRIVNVQARAICNVERKTLVPTGSCLAGTVFANAAGIELLRGATVACPSVILGEGLTDFLALGVASQIPVLSCPGTGCAVRAVGEWVRGRTLVVALDCDAAGETAVKPVARAGSASGAALVQCLRWPDGCKDACDVVARRGLDGLAAWLAAKLDG